MNVENKIGLGVVLAVVIEAMFTQAEIIIQDDFAGIGAAGDGKWNLVGVASIECGSLGKF